MLTVLFDRFKTEDCPQHQDVPAACNRDMDQGVQLLLLRPSRPCAGAHDYEEKQAEFMLLSSIFNFTRLELGHASKVR